MTVAYDWLAEAFFEEPDLDSLDGGTTSHGPLWHAITPRWGHSMHTMCPYQGMFPPRLAHYFINQYSEPGDMVLDPFSGRGTTTLQARVEGRRTISNDLSPLGYVLSAAKANPPSWSAINEFVNKLERAFKRRANREIDAPDDIRMLFHENTLRQIVFIRACLLQTPIMRWNNEELMLAGALAGILHGSHRPDGSSLYLSISMPNTFSMAPTYVKNFIREHNLKKIDQNVFDCLRVKLSKIYLDSVEGGAGSAFSEDAPYLLKKKDFATSSVDLVVTSPPYLQVVNYGTSNWIRLWLLGLDEVSRHGGTGRLALDAGLDHQHRFDAYRDFLLRSFKGVRRVLKKDGVAVFVIGDVASADGTSIDLAKTVWGDIGNQTGLRLLDLIEDSLQSQNKVSRIWGETKGRATNQECVLILARSDGEPAMPNHEVDWDEPYKDGGPDAAHAGARYQRIAS